MNAYAQDNHQRSVAMIDPTQLRVYVIEPILKEMEEETGLDFYSESAVRLLLGTFAQESTTKGGAITYLKQKGGGPALGIYQMEPNTYMDIRSRYLKDRPVIRCYVERYDPYGIPVNILTDLALATIMARLKYYMVPEPLPKPDDITGLAQYWKKYYNTPEGAGTTNEFAHKYSYLIVPTLNNQLSLF